MTAIKADQFAVAIPLLEGVVKRDDRNANAYNWLGYAVRKNGDPAASIPIYQKALEAKEHLARLDKLCFLPCEEYTDLKKAVEAYEKTRKTSR